MTEHVVGGSNLSEAWARAFIRVEKSKAHELLPLVVTVNTTFGATEDTRIRTVLSDCLKQCGEYDVDTVANTIFPQSLWNRAAGPEALFARYDKLWPRIRRHPDNRNGTYFRRMMAFGDGRAVAKNQIEHVLKIWADGNHRRSALQLAIFDPHVDHVTNRQRGFPCLQQVALAPSGDGCLSITGFYATQTMFEKAYGNYLGLIRLGEFFAHHMGGLQLTQMTCITSVAKLSLSLKSSDRDNLVRELSALVRVKS